MIISRTPYRISFFGGGTDYPEWYQNHGGEVLSATIDRYSYVTCRTLPPFFNHKHRVAYSRLEDVVDESAVEHPVVRAAFKKFQFKKGLSIHHDGDLPAWSGIGSSSTFTVGLLQALYAHRGIHKSSHELAVEAIDLEQNVLNECVGCQDQIAASYGGFNHIQIDRSGAFEVRPVVASAEKLQELQNSLILVFTGQKRLASGFANEKVSNIPNREIELREIQAMVNEGISILHSKSGSLTSFAELLHQGWLLKKRLASSVSNSHVNAIYDEAIKHGAMAGKLCGAGGGGFMFFMVPPHRQEGFLDHFKNLVAFPVSFSQQGASVIWHDQVSKHVNSQVEYEEA